MNREAFNRNQRARRAILKRRGLCVDCGKNPVRKVQGGANMKGRVSTARGAEASRNGKKPSLCDSCSDARKLRWHNGAVPPLLRLIQKAELS
jgi:hypothetical protein